LFILYFLTINKPKYEQFLWIFTWIGLSALLWYLVDLKYLALDFHSRDYPFYTEFIIKWSLPIADQSYSLNPGGYNLFGVSAVDGCDGFYQWIHIEPIRFLQAFIFKVTHSLQAVFFLNALFICSPVLGIIGWLNKMGSGSWEKMVWILFFISFPATLLAAGYDNRPSMFLGIGYFWVLFFFLVTKNHKMQYLSFLFLFLIREEAFILNGIVCLFLFFKWRKKEVTLTMLLLFVLSWLAYCVAIYTYFNYWNYQFFMDDANKYPLSILIPTAVIIVGWLGYSILKKKYEMILILPFFIFSFQLLSMHMNQLFPDQKFNIYNDPRLLMPFMVMVAYALYMRSKGKKLPYGVTFIAIPVFLLFSGIGKNSLVEKIHGWQHSQSSMQPVFAFYQSMQKERKIITDYTFHQCFLGHKKLYCIDRLPCSLDRSASRFYPANTNILATIMEPGAFLVVSRQTFLNIQLLLKDYESRFIQQGNDLFIIELISPIDPSL
jgi:hypothetical protein